MTGKLVFEERLHIPLDVGSLDAFRRWALSDDFPEEGRIDFVASQIEVDMSREDLFTHGTVKTEFVSVLRRRVKSHIAGPSTTRPDREVWGRPRSHRSAGQRFRRMAA
ncbi:MAG: hypothetical protein O7J95_16240 [Planctomycetota bacterium]|nr:hypothetical protein [Planctomycetota bacterium]